MSDKGSAGGKARAKIQKQEARQRIDEYNKNPNKCLCCNNPIIAPYGKKLHDTKIKKFCSHSCATKYNNIGNVHNFYGNNGVVHSIIDSVSDEEIINAFYSSDSINEFSKKIGYKNKIHYNNDSVRKRLDKLNLKLEDLKRNIVDIKSDTKGNLFKRRNQWQNARSAIQKQARLIYQNSDKPKRCICCGYDKHYEVAHIRAVSDFNDNALISEINDVNNLIALCPNHHWEYDNTDFDITPFLDEVS